MAATILMFDDTNVSLLPAGYDAYAAYVDGRYANLTAVRQKFPKAQILTIDVTGSNTAADCLDIEAGDATNATAVTWTKAKVAAKAKLIVDYTSVSNVDILVGDLAAAGIPRSAYKLWSAHYGAGAHVCGPATCKLTSYACDGTQFTNQAFGDSLDESIVDSDFFGAVTPPPAGSDPLLIQGDTGDAVRSLQTRLNAWGYKIAVDGSFGTETENAVRDFQTKHKIGVDGVVGPQTWSALDAAPPAPKPPAPAPLPAPGHLGEDFTKYPLIWDAVKGATAYNIKIYDTTTGKRIQNGTVSGTSTILGRLVGAKHYDVYVTALGGPTEFGYAVHTQIIG